MASSSFSSSSTSPSGPFDIFPNSGNIYTLEIQSEAEKVASDILHRLISSAMKTSSPTAPLIDETKESKDTINQTPLRFFVLGCGEHNPVPKKVVAQLMNEIAKKQKPHIIILLGDNFNSTGLKSPVSEEFKTGFDDVYQIKELAEIYGIPFFVIPGNHDHGFPVLYPRRITGINNDLKAIAHQVKHTYIDKAGNVLLEKEKLFAGNILPLSELKKHEQTWNMPGRYYGLKHGNTELFFIDSNTYVKEYIECFLKRNMKNNQQPLWLQTVAKNPNTTKLLFMHHSLKPKGKRAAGPGSCPETREYLSPDDIRILHNTKVIRHGTEGYHEILELIFKKQGLQFSTAFAAHDHSLYHHYEPPTKNSLFRQLVVAGGAGGGNEDHLQNRFVFDNQTPCFIKSIGLVSVLVPASPEQPIQYNYHSVPQLALKPHSIPGHHIRFHSENPNPIRSNLDEVGVQELKQIILAACKEYVEKYPPPRNAIFLPYYNSWADKGVIKKALDFAPPDAFFADDLKNFFNRFEANTFANSMHYIKYAFSKSPILRAVFFSQKLLLTHNITYKLFIDLPLKDIQDWLITKKAPNLEIETKEIPQPSAASTVSVASIVIMEGFSFVKMWNYLSGIFNTGFIAETKMSPGPKASTQTSSTLEMSQRGIQISTMSSSSVIIPPPTEAKSFPPEPLPLQPSAANTTTAQTPESKSPRGQLTFS